MRERLPGAGRRRWQAASVGGNGWLMQAPDDAGRWGPLQGFCGRVIVYPHRRRVPLHAVLEWASSRREAPPHFLADPAGGFVRQPRALPRPPSLCAESVVSLGFGVREREVAMALPTIFIDNHDCL